MTVHVSSLSVPVYDAAVIGAGPAGLLCARDVARNGLRTALIDSHNRPGVKLSVAGEAAATSRTGSCTKTAI